MRFSSSSLLLSLAALGLMLGGCESIAPKNPTPDLRIQVRKGSDGKLEAIAPKCADWTKESSNPFDNQPLPQFGCATAQNLAAMVEDPADLVRGRGMGGGDGEYTSSSVLRYRAGATKPLIDPHESKPVSQPSLKDSGLKENAPKAGL